MNNPHSPPSFSVANFCALSAMFAVLLAVRSAQGQTTITRLDNNAAGLSSAADWSGAPSSTTIGRWNGISAANSTTSIGSAMSLAGIQLTASQTNSVFITANGTNTLTLGNASVNDTIDLSAAGADLSIAARVALATANQWNIASGRTLTVTGTITSSAKNLTITGAGNGFISGNITLNSSSLIKSGTGTLTLIGANQSTIPTTVILAGILNIRNVSALGLSGATTTVASGATLQIQGSLNMGFISSAALTLSGTGASGQNGALVSLSGLNSYGASITLAGDTTISADSGSLTLSGAITGAGRNLTVMGAGDMRLSRSINTAAGGLTKNGTGTLTLSGTNSFSGGVTLNAGVLVLGSAGALSSATPNNVTFGAGVSAGTKLQLNANSITVSGLSTNATPGAPVIENGGTGGVTFTVNNAGASIYAGALQDGAGGGTLALAKTGGGTLTLSGANTYTGGTVVNGGMLTLDGSSASGSNLTLGGSGAIFNYRGPVTGGSQTLGVLTFTHDGATVQTTYGTSGNTLLTFASLTARTDSGPSRNFAVIGGSNGSTNRIVLTGQATGFIDPGTFFGGDNYAFYDAGGFVRGINYGTDIGSVTVGTGTTLGDVTGQHVQLFGGITAQTTVSLNTLNIGGALDLTLADAGQVLTLSGGGLLKGNGGAATISGGSLTTGSGTELVVRTDLATDLLTVASAIASTTTGGVSKSGAGTLVLSGANSFTGGLTIYNGTVIISSVGALNATTPNRVAFGAGSSGQLQLSGNSVTVGGLSTDAATPGSPIVENASASSVMLTSSSTGADTYAGILRDGVGGGTLSLTKTGAGTQTLSGTNSYTGGTSLNAGTLVIANVSALGAGTLTIAAGASLDATGGTIANVLNLAGDFTYVGTGAATFSGSIAALSGNRTITVSASTLTLSGAISDAGNGQGLTKEGGGTLALNGASTYTGGTTVNGGVVIFGSATAIAGSGANVLLNNWAAVVANYAMDQAFLARVSGSSNGTVLLGANSSNSLNFSTAGLNSVSLGAAPSKTVSYSGTLTPASATYRLGGGDSASFLTLSKSNALTGTNSLIISGSGTVYLANSNNYSGGTTLASGTLIVGVGSVGSSLGSGALTITGGTFGTTFTGDTGGGVPNSLRIAGDFSVGRIGMAEMDYAGPVTIAGGNHVVTVAENGRISFFGTIGDGGNGYGLTKAGLGVMDLNAQNTYSGGTTVSSGILVASTGLPLGGAVTINGGTLNLGDGGGSPMVGGVTLANGGEVQNGTLISTSSFTLESGLVTQNSNLSGSAFLTKSTGGTATLAGANTYTGPTTINSGKLVVNGSIAAESAVIVNNGATLAGVGTVGGAVTLMGGGRISPGNDFVSSQGSFGINFGTFTLGSLLINGRAALNLQLNLGAGTVATPGVAGTDWTQLVTIGAADFSALTAANRLTLELTGAFGTWDDAVDHTYSSFLTGASITGFAPGNFAIDTSAFGSAFTGAFSVAQNGNSLDLHYSAASIPEPATTAMLIGALALGIGFAVRRRQRNA